MKTKTKFIPGPWRISNNIRGIDNVKCWGVEADLTNHGIIAPGIPTFYTHIVANCGSSGKAEARLISAAPELLAALEVAVKRVQMANNEGDTVLSAWLPEALAAIAKAKGDL